ncbi:hypothetical protein, partial [Streptomyces alkaliphilus]|uniref:hypothetical protein n=1 Tax=Streptomyces alkaliphilus TaxID=1472722 RepID=UPI001E552A77
APPPPTVGGRQGIARRAPEEGSNPHPPTGRYPVAWLHIVAPGRGTTPTASSWCECGHRARAVGRTRVLALIDTHHRHRDACPLRTTTDTTTTNERRSAA